MLSTSELIMIAVILLIVLGPSRLLNMGPALGKSLRGFIAGVKGEDSYKEDPLHRKEKDITPPKNP